MCESTQRFLRKEVTLGLVLAITLPLNKVILDSSANLEIVSIHWTYNLVVYTALQLEDATTA